MYKRYICAFANSEMGPSLSRFKKQAIKMGIYDGIFLYTEHSLEKDFYNYWQDKFKLRRGYGYWVWKPKIILQTLEKMHDGDILQYSDIGCHLNRQGIPRLHEYFEMAYKSPCGILAFQYIESPDKNLKPKGDRLESHWTKGDLFDYFNVRDQDDIYNTDQIWSGTFFIRKATVSVNIIQEWMKIYYDDFSLIDDSPSKTPNFEGFIENRHDQSAFSILCKKNKVPVVSAWECDQDWKRLNKYPIQARRDKKRYLIYRILSRITFLLNTKTSNKAPQKD